MNCLDARRALGEEPGRRTAELEAHLATCRACAEHAAEAARLEITIRRALEVPVPEPGAHGTGRAAGPGRRGRPLQAWFALAASVAGVALLVGLLWSAYPREALATALVAHMAHEPQSRNVTSVAVEPAALAYVLRRSGVELAPATPLISYAHSCWFRGRFVPHLVVQTPDGPMTVMVLPHEHVAGPTSVDEGGYRVVIVAVAQGALGVLADPAVASARIDAVVARVAAAVRFTG